MDANIQARCSHQRVYRIYGGGGQYFVVYVTNNQIIINMKSE